MDSKRAKDLLRSYLRGECSHAEKAIVEKWYQQQGQEHADSSMSERIEDRKFKNWDSLQRQISAYNREQLYRRLGKVAAVALILLSAGLIIWNNTERGNEETNTLSSILAENAKSDRANMAMITLADGREIVLDDNQSEIVIAEDGIRYVTGEPLVDAERVRSSTQGVNESALLTISTPRGGHYQVNLPDGTKVWLNAATTIKYPMHFSVQNRVVYLDGEAYFSVKKNLVKGDQSKFQVITAQQKVEVYGTEFNVSAYDNEPDERTTLVTGSVRVANNSSGQVYSLHPGNQSVVAGALTSVAPVEVNHFVAWKEGVLVFEQVDFATLMRQIERLYDVEFIVEFNKLPMTFSGEVPRNVALTEILKTLELNSKVKFQMEGRRIRMTN